MASVRFGTKTALKSAKEHAPTFTPGSGVIGKSFLFGKEVLKSIRLKSAEKSVMGKSSGLIAASQSRVFSPLAVKSKGAVRSKKK